MVVAELNCGSRQQRHALGGNRLFPADSPDVLAGLGLEPDLVRPDAQNLGQPAADRLLVGRSLGRWAKTMQSTLTIRQPAARTRSRAARSISAESRPRLAGSVSGNISPMSPRAAAPSRASVTAWSSTSASLWPTARRSWGMSIPPKRIGPPGSSRCVSWPIPTRTSVVVVSPCRIVGCLTAGRPSVRAADYTPESGKPKAESRVVTPATRHPPPATSSSFIPQPFPLPPDGL